MTVSTCAILLIFYCILAYMCYEVHTGQVSIEVKLRYLFGVHVIWRQAWRPAILTQPAIF